MPGSPDESRSDNTPAATTSTGLVRRRPALVWVLAAIVPVLLTAVLIAVRTARPKTTSATVRWPHSTPAASPAYGRFLRPGRDGRRTGRG